MRYPGRRHYNPRPAGGAGSGSGSSSGAANEIQKGNGAGAFQGTKVFSPSNGDLQLGDAALAGALRLIQAAGIAANIDLYLATVGAGKARSNGEFSSEGLTYASVGGKLSVVDTSQSGRFFIRSLGEKGSLAGDASLSISVFELSVLPNNSRITATIECNAIRSDGVQSYSITIKAHYKKNNAGVLSKIADVAISSSLTDLPAGTAALTTVLSGTTLQASITQSGGVTGTFHLSHLVDITAHSY